MTRGCWCWNNLNQWAVIFLPSSCIRPSSSKKSGGGEVSEDKDIHRWVSGFIHSGLNSDEANLSQLVVVPDCVNRWVNTSMGSDGGASGVVCVSVFTAGERCCSLSTDWPLQRHSFGSYVGCWCVSCCCCLRRRGSYSIHHMCSWNRELFVLRTRFHLHEHVIVIAQLLSRHTYLRRITEVCLHFCILCIYTAGELLVQFRLPHSPLKLLTYI